MGIMTRFVKLCKADMHGMMDRLENRELLLRQYIREMEESIAKQETELEKMVAEQERTEREYETCSKEMEKTEQDLAVAIEKNKDHIARFLIKKLKPMTRQRDALSRHSKTLTADIAGLSDRIRDRRRLFGELKIRSGAYLRKQESRRLESEFREIAAMDLLHWDIPDEEVEIELIRRKEALHGGA